MKILLILILSVGCALNRTETAAPLTITQKLEICVHARIQDGVKPLDALKICDTIYRGRFE